jgi:predicted nucleotidyltransferase
MNARADERLDLMDALVYGDAFDCAVTLDELWRYARVRVGRAAFLRLLEEDPALRSLVAECNGLYSFADRPELLVSRPASIERARALQKRASRVARVIRHVPFVRAVALTGSAAADDAGEEADVDLLVVVEHGRLGTVFVLLGAASRVLGRRLFCPNYYVSNDDVAVESRGVYVARELEQARVLVGDPNALRAANGWLRDVFPNLPPRSGHISDFQPSSVQRVLESVLAGRLEGWSRRLASARLRAHYGAFGSLVPPDVAAAFAAGRALRFHAGETVTQALGRYEARRAQLAAALAGVGSVRETG